MLSVCVETSRKPRLKECKRVGEMTPGKVRPVKLSFDSGVDVGFMLRNARNPKNSRFNSV